VGTSKYDVTFDLETVQGRLYYARVAHRLTRAVVGKAFGAKPNAIKNWERGENGVTTVPYEYIVFATVAYGVPESWLLGDTHETPLAPPARQTDLERLMSGVDACPATLLRRRLKSGWRQLAHLKRVEPLER
jgi:transcriptional regulator with XRE-family HTH domain